MPDDARIDDVESVIDTLYGLAPADFTGTRNDVAKALRKEKRKDDAARVAKLPKPTTAAWALNQIARQRPDLVQALLAQGSQLRDVQDRVLSGDAEPRLLLQASEERRRSIREVVSAMSKTLEAGEAKRTDEWVRTLETASVDDRLAQLLTTGRFTTVALEGVGFDGLLTGPDPVPRHLTVVPPLADNAPDRESAERESAAAHRALAAQREAERIEAERRAALAKRQARIDSAKAAAVAAREAVAVAERSADDAAAARLADEQAVRETEQVLDALRARLAASKQTEETAIDARTRAEVTRAASEDALSEAERPSPGAES